MKRYLGNVAVVNKYLSAAKVIEAGDKVYYRGFSCAGRSYKGNTLSCLNVKAYVFKNICPCFLSKGNVSEMHVPFYRRHFLCPNLILNSNRLVHHLKNSFKICYCINKSIHKI